jgi:hypothetical protein
MDLTAKNHNFDDFGWDIYIYNDDRPWHGIGYLILDRPTHTSIGKFTPLAYHLPATMGNFPVYQVGLRL